MPCVTLNLSFCPLSGLCAITGVSVFANMLVTNFWMSTTNMYQGMQNVQNRWVLQAASGCSRLEISLRAAAEGLANSGSLLGWLQDLEDYS